MSRSTHFGYFGLTLCFLSAFSWAAADPAALHLVVGAPDGGRVRPLLGVNAGPAPSGEPGNADLTQAYRELGVNLVRTHDFYGPLDMSEIYPNLSADPKRRDSYDFAASDATFKTIVEGGFEPYLRLGDSWNDARAPKTEKERSNWAEAALQVVKHYAKGQWNGFKANFRYVEIGNEPDIAQFWPGAPYEEFPPMFALAHKKIKAAFPTLKVGGPGFSLLAYKTPEGQRRVADFLALARQKRLKLDFLSWHLYSNVPDDYFASARFYRESLDRYGFGKAESHNTEWNTDDYASHDPAWRTGCLGASTLSAGWIAFQRAGLDVSTFFRGNDTSPDLPTFYGLFYADGRPKANAHAFSLWRDFVGYGTRLALSATDAAGGAADGQLSETVWGIAAASADNATLAVLLANAGDTPVAYDLALTGGQTLSGATVKEMTCPDGEIVSYPLSGPGNGLPANAVQLILISKK